jgi:hypothetical protein
MHGFLMMINRIIGIYIAMAIMFAGIGIGSEMAMHKPDYKLIFFMSVFWPLFLLFALYTAIVK